ncbi:hypothetical protein, partial [Winogradskyella sp.]|uniref:hypothetical protein n=1 Tax=Winogradskyella sp. TaxID=1883156 RepID=UPI0025DD13EB
MKQLKNKIKKIFYDGHLELSKYYVVNFKAIFSYYFSKFIIDKNDKIYLNFLVTSKAELRMFRPIIVSVLKNNSFRSHVFYLSNHQYDKEMNSKIHESDNVSISNSIYPIIKSFNSKNYLNIICLDHASFYKQHSVGVDIMKYIRKQGGKTVCVQHGGTQEDNIDGHKTSESLNQIVFGKYVYNKLIAEDIDDQYVFLTGNPLHDLTVNKQKINIDRFNAKNKKVITLITCL